jgi:hypothetical protein
MQDRINAARAQMGAAKDEDRRRPLGGAPEVKIPPLHQLEQGRQPARKENVPPPPPGVGVGAAYPAARERSFGTDPMAGAQVENAGQDPDDKPGKRPGRMSSETAEGLDALSRAQDEENPAPLPPSAGGSMVQEEEDLEEPEPRDRSELVFSSAVDEVEREVEKATNLLMNEERRNEIESRLEPLDFDDWLQNFEIQQMVPIIPGRFEPTFRTPSGHEDLFVRSYIGRDRGVDSYIVSKFSLLTLTVALVDINGKIKFPNHLDPKTGQVDEEKFEEKLNKVLRLPLQWLADLSVNYMWFEVRARKLLTFTEVKNG